MVRTVLALLAAICLHWPAVAGATEPTPQGALTVPQDSRPGPGFDAERATRAYLDSVLFIFFVNFIGPVFVMPLFNKFQPLGPGSVRDSVLALARANVSGLFGPTRISLNDNPLGRTSLLEIKAVMAHEPGHYVLNHPFKRVLQFGLVLAAGFAFAQWAQRLLLARWGQRRDVRGAGDVAGLPLVIALLSLWFFVMTPVTNSIVRNAETEADLIRMAMAWLAENPGARAGAQPGGR